MEGRIAKHETFPKFDASESISRARRLECPIDRKILI